VPAAPERSAIERDLQQLEVNLKRLEAEYNMYFSGRLPKPPWETRKLVADMVTKYDRGYISNYGDRFRFTTLQSRFASFVDLWDKALGAKEEGRSGPLVHQRKDLPERKKRPEDRIYGVASFKNVLHEQDKLHELYDQLVEARKEVGQEGLPFHKFAEIVKGQVKKLRDDGNAEVAFRVAVKDGKVAFTARALKGAK
jgi:hypothetical protein